MKFDEPAPYKGKVILDRETLHKLYCEEKLSQRKIAKMLGIKCHSTIRRWLFTYKIPLRQYGKRGGIPKPIDETLFRRLYLTEKLSLEEIKKRLKRSSWSIYYWMRRYGIEARRWTKSYKSLEQTKLIQGKATDVEKAYITGIIDGEGSIHLQQSNGTSFNPILSISNTNKQLLEKIKAIIGGKINPSKNELRHPRQKPAFVLIISNFRNVLETVRRLEPFLFVKKPQANLIIEFCESRLRRFHEHYNRREKWIHAELKRMNKRGI